MRFPPCLSLLVASAALAGGPPPATQPSATTAAAEPEVNLRHTIVVDVAKRSKDAVVAIFTDKVVAQSVAMFPNQPGSPREIQYRPGFTLGSGFIIDPSGYIVTNNHVIERAQKIRVETPAGDKFEAEVIGALPEADLAILKVKADHPLATLSLGDSSDLMVGEPVIAIGNPRSFTYSVSTGIVSAVHRDILHRDVQADPQKAALEELIQTDAAINPGNSGGPLLNAYGQVIGINWAVRTDAQNIGLAIEVNRLRDLIPTLMNPEVAAKLQIPLKFAEHRTTTPPSTVTSEVNLVTPDGDRPVESINGKPVRTIVDACVAMLEARAKVPITVVAGGVTTTVTPEPVPVPDAIAIVQRRLGIVVEPNSPDNQMRHGLARPEGMLVTEVVARSLAGTAGIQPNDLVVQLGSTQTLTYDQFAAAVRQLPASGQVQIAILRGTQLLKGTLTL